MTQDTTQNEPSESENSDATEANSPERSDSFETIHPALRLGVRFAVKFLWVVGRLVVIGSMMTFSFLTNHERRVRTRRRLLLEATAGPSSAVSSRGCSCSRTC